ncbi:uncharacterized protein [Amphiura filiformis]|uniref:uncharacterized protein n=1 Tax=Amphiura filiformis TaxID=82378 RepID=UPI003B216D8B
MLLRLQPVKWARMYIGLVYDESSKKHRWLDGRPLSFTDWSPYDVAGYLNAQPDNGRAGRCSMLRLETLYSTQNWHDIPCAAVLTSIYMCSKLSPKAMDYYRKETPLIENASISVPHTYCPAGMFQCHSGECIHSIYVCDEIVDCLDASDEEQPSCESMLLTFVTMSLREGV